MPRLLELEGLRGPGPGGDERQGESIQARIARSRSWASWAPGLKAALVVPVREELGGHVPYNRECKSCVIAASRGKAHKRISHPDAYALSIDAAGPFQLAEDQLGKGRYLLVGVYLAPVTKDGQCLIPINEEDELAGALGDGPDLPGWNGSRWRVTFR